MAYFGFAVGAARVFNAWGYLPFGMPLPTPAEYGAFARELFPTIVQGLLMLLVGLGIIGAAVAGLLRKEWAPTVLMLNEHMAIVLYAVAALMGLARIYLADRPESYSWSLAAWVASELAINLGYPVLAAAIFRTRAVRAWFRTPVEAADE